MGVKTNARLGKVLLGLLVGVLLGGATARSAFAQAPAATQPAPAAGAIRLIVRGDDMGNSHAANEACIQSYREGIMLVSYGDVLKEQQKP